MDRRRALASAFWLAWSILAIGMASFVFTTPLPILARASPSVWLYALHLADALVLIYAFRAWRRLNVSRSGRALLLSLGAGLVTVVVAGFVWMPMRRLPLRFAVDLAGLLTVVVPVLPLAFAICFYEFTRLYTGKLPWRESSKSLLWSAAAVYGGLAGYGAVAGMHIGSDPFVGEEIANYLLKPLWWCAFLIVGVPFFLLACVFASLLMRISAWAQFRT